MPQGPAGPATDGNIPAPVAPPSPSERAAPGADAANLAVAAEDRDIDQAVEPASSVAGAANTQPPDPQADVAALWGGPTGQAPVASADERVPELTARPAEAEAGLLMPVKGLTPPVVSTNTSARAIVADTTPPAAPDTAPQLVAALPAALEHPLAKAAIADDATPPAALPRPMATDPLATLPEAALADSPIAEDAALHPATVILASTEPLRATPKLSDSPEAGALSSALDFDPPAVVAPHESPLRDDGAAAAPAGEATTPAADAPAGRTAFSGDIVTAALPAASEADVGEPADQTGDGADLLGGTSYRQASVQAALPPARDAVQTLMSEAQSVLDEATQAPDDGGQSASVPSGVLPEATRSTAGGRADRRHRHRQGSRRRAAGGSQQAASQQVASLQAASQQVATAGSRPPTSAPTAGRWRWWSRPCPPVR